jgi:hypothetical protein
VVWFSIRFSSFLFYSVQKLNSRNCKRLRELKEKSQGKAVYVAVNSKEENFKDFCLDFVQEFGHRPTKCFLVKVKVL